MDYFDEMGWEPVNEENIQQHQTLLMVRFMQENGFWPDNFNGHELPPPASKDVVNELPEKRFKRSQSDAEKSVKCAICLKTILDTDDDETNKTAAGNDEVIFRVLPCTHYFHDTCILPWLEKTNSCPLCRFELKTDDPGYEQMKKDRERAKQREEDLDNLHNSMFG